MKTPHVVYDEILPTLEPRDQAVFNQLFRLSWGHGRGWCKIGMPKLAERAKMSERSARDAVRELQKRGLVEPTEVDYGGGNRKDAGTTYAVLIEGLSPADFAAPAKGATPALAAAPASAAAMKEIMKETLERAANALAEFQKAQPLSSPPEQRAAIVSWAKGHGHDEREGERIARALGL